ncbi:MAG: hypothetical protein AAF433_01930 [Bacteroidota bacterium]
MNHPLTILFGGVLLVLSACQTKVPTEPAHPWQVDLDFFGQTLAQKHKNLFAQLPEAEFERALAELRAVAPELSEAAMLIELEQILARIGDAHTRIEAADRRSALPFRVSWLAEGLVLTAIEATQADYLGETLSHINGQPVAAVIDQFRQVITYENESHFKFQFSRQLHYAEYHYFFDWLAPGQDVALRFTTGESVALAPLANDLSRIQLPDPPLFLQKPRVNYWMRPLVESAMVYLQYNRCREAPDVPMTDFAAALVQELQANPGIQKVVLDVRRNGGGNSTVFRPLLAVLKELVDSGRLAHDQIYVFIGRNTFSSAVLNVLELERTLDPVFVGEPTGGKPNHFGELKNFRLPNSGLRVWYSTKYFQLSDDDLDAFYPDQVVELSLADLLAGIDPALEWVKEN